MQIFASRAKDEHTSRTKSARSTVEPKAERHDPVTTISSPTIFRKAACACGGGCDACQQQSRALSVSRPNDPSEVEADAIAEKVMRMPQDGRSSGVESARVTGSITSRINSSGAGEPLPPATRNFFESRFRTSLDGVHIHTGDESARLNTDVSAQAFTFGSDIFFGAGQYQPDTNSGRHVIAHELAHVLQQSTNDSAVIHRQAPPAGAGAQASGGRNDAVVQALIDDALARKPSVEAAFRDLQSRRCLPENCGDENLAAAEHYMFVRHWVQDGLLPAEVKALFMAGVMSGYAILKLIGAMPSFCPDICPVTPTSFFQLKWELTGIEDGMLVGKFPTPPVGYVPLAGSGVQP
jgi:hypothetical protein